MTVQLRINGVVITGWTQVSTVRSIERVAAECTLQWAGYDPSIRLDDACQLLLDEQLVLDGYVDEIKVEQAADSLTTTFKARSKTALLVDNAAKLNDGYQANDITLTNLARAFCTPLGLHVHSDLERVPFATHTFLPIPVVSLNPGESMFTTLSRIAKEHGVLLYGYGDTVYITRNLAAHTGAQLVLGKNILALTYHNSSRQIYKTCEVLGQNSATTDALGQASNSYTGLPKHLVVVADEAADTDTCTEQAGWELGIRAARALRIEVTVIGWLYNSQLWTVNKQVRLVASKCGIDSDYIIAQVQYVLDGGGKRTVLTLRSKDAFARQPK